MIETFAALLLAHALADFVLQPAWMVETKRQPRTLALHTVVVLITAQVALGRIDAWSPIIVAAAHLAVDIVKTFLLPRRLWVLLSDQAAHLATIALVAAATPDLFAGGLWDPWDWVPTAMAAIAGLILTMQAGSHAVALLVSPWNIADLPVGLPNGGRLIGLLERGIVFLLIMTGYPSGIGFLIAAKSIGQLGISEKDQTMRQYVLVGTLASFGWAMVAGWATLALLSRLPPLGILPAAP